MMEVSGVLISCETFVIRSAFSFSSFILVFTAILIPSPIELTASARLILSEWSSLTSTLALTSPFLIFSITWIIPSLSKFCLYKYSPTKASKNPAITMPRIPILNSRKFMTTKRTYGIQVLTITLVLFVVFNIIFLKRATIFLSTLSSHKTVSFPFCTSP